MTSKPAIRRTTAEDLDAILALYPRAFAEEDLTGIVREILTGNALHLSLGSLSQSQCISHVIFTALGGDSGDWTGALLAPLAVDPDHQRQGLGRALTFAGLEELAGLGVQQVFVLGDPQYYGKLGFKAERVVQPPYPLPPEYDGAWQSMTVKDRVPLRDQVLRYPEPWLKPELW
ncbi:MAG: N-acetyltransferase [Pseudomonadota bacterium]